MLTADTPGSGKMYFFSENDKLLFVYLKFIFFFVKHLIFCLKHLNESKSGLLLNKKEVCCQLTLNEPESCNRIETSRTFLFFWCEA